MRRVPIRSNCKNFLVPVVSQEKHARYADLSIPQPLTITALLGKSIKKGGIGSIKVSRTLSAKVSTSQNTSIAVPNRLM